MRDKLYFGVESGKSFREPDIRTAKAFAWVLTEKERMEQGIIYNPNVSELTDE